MSTDLVTHSHPQSGFLKLKSIIGDPKATPPIPALIPVGRTTFLNRVKSGEYPSPIKLGGQKSRSVAWRRSDIDALIAQISGQ
jgi:prophage regulatory protein